MLKYKGTLLGKNVITFGDTKKICHKALIREYKKFDKIQLLRVFSDISVELFKTGENIIIFSGIPVNIDFLNYCVLNAIKHSNGLITEIGSSERDKIFKISFPWYQHTIYGSSNRSPESLVKVAYRQFVYQESKAMIARSVYIYNFLWPQKYNDLFNIHNAFIKMYGITYDKFLFYGMDLTGSKELYYYAKDYGGDFNEKTTSKQSSAMYFRIMLVYC